ncbi:MAG: hypothetical protein OQK82_09400 [Candidatus Pacearchaeota archaeon]|nr:hypothetical protein [Candidatus Pacearchaeota archaeon]
MSKRKEPKTIPMMARLDPSIAERVRNKAKADDRSVSYVLSKLITTGLNHCNRNQA